MVLLPMIGVSDGDSGDSHAAYSRKCTIYNREFDIQSIRVSRNISFFQARTVYQQTHRHRVINYAGTRAPIQTTSVCTKKICHGLGPNMLHGSNVLLLLSETSRAVRLTISVYYHSCRGCGKNCGSTYVVTSEDS